MIDVDLQLWRLTDENVDKEQLSKPDFILSTYNFDYPFRMKIPSLVDWYKNIYDELLGKVFH